MHACIYFSFVGDCKFVSVTCRLFKLPETREAAKKVTYKGSVSKNEKELEFDYQNTFKVCL